MLCLLLLDDHRVFVGDLGHEVNDDMLYRTFAHLTSLLKARVIRDKRTHKSKGFGFVSFKDSRDYLRALKDMDGITRHCVPDAPEFVEILDIFMSGTE